MLFKRSISYKAATTLVAVLVLGSFRASAQDVPPPPKPKDDGPSLEVTMNFVIDKLNSQGSVSYIESFEPSDRRYHQDTKVRDATANIPACSLSFHRLTVEQPAMKDVNYILKSGETTNQLESEDTVEMSMRDVEKVAVELMENSPFASRHAVDNIEQITHIAPPVYDIAFTYVKGKSARVTTVKSNGERVRETDERDVLIVLFREEDLAHRVARALVHAVELCGGGSKDPF